MEEGSALGLQPTQVKQLYATEMTQKNLMYGCDVEGGIDLAEDREGWRTVSPDVQTCTGRTKSK